jgi:hypothetical protein
LFMSLFLFLLLLLKSIFFMVDIVASSFSVNLSFVCEWFLWNIKFK